MKSDTYIRILLLLFAVLCPVIVHSQSLNNTSDQWTATDGLGRKLPSASETGLPRNDKYIAMFYWTWHTDGNATFSPVMNITQILEQYPEAATDADHPAWQGISPGVFWWDEPLFGYYRTTDEWILRKHAEMLADAGVDVVFFDCTNGSLTWKTSYTVLLKVWDLARKDGVRAPQVAFLLPFSATTGALSSLHELYTELYLPELYKDQWFMWDDKPLVMAYPECLVPQEGSNAGLRFTATAPFYAVSATCPSWSNSIGNITFRIYRWDVTYARSVAGIPIAEKTFVNFNDNEKLILDFGQQEAGDYVWELTNGTEQVGVWKWTDSQDPVTSYFNGAQVSGNYESEISYDPDLVFTALTTGTEHTAIAVVGAIDQQVVNVMKDFFTFRPGQPDYVNGPSRDDHWGWLENYPQHGYAPNPEGGYEEATVGVAQNASAASGGHAAGFNSPLTYGRSYTKTAGQDTRQETYLKGLNFQEQWQGAFAIDPEVIFVTGWNEWIAGRWFDWDVKPFAFVDEYSAEKSRDIEPVKSWGRMGDVYYMQLIDNIRKFKGMSSLDTVSASKTVDMNDIGSWTDVLPEYLAYQGNTMHRDHAGQGDTLTYTNTTGRNDIVSAKVARDDSCVYFYVKTSDNLTDRSDPGWMRLFIDIDRDKKTGWEGYDFVINRLNPEDSAYIEKSATTWDWEPAGAGGYTISGNTLVLKVKRSVLDLARDLGVDFEFKWSDNMQEEGNIMDFYVNGDAAPGARFNYIYKVDWTDDRYRRAEYPGNINQGLICDFYEGVFDTIPSFSPIGIDRTEYPATFSLPSATENDFGLRFTGYIEVPEKDTYTFYLEADLAACLYIGYNLVVPYASGQGEQSGTIRLMPGKHSISVDYITNQEHAKLLNISLAGTNMEKGEIFSSMLFRYNQPPTVSLKFNEIQNYFTPFDSTVIVEASDPDGGIAGIEIYDNEQLIGTETTASFTVSNLPVGDHRVYAKATDSNGSSAESNVLAFTVKPWIVVPGTIYAEDYRKGKNVTIVQSTDTDSGKNIKVTYGYVDYPVNVTETGMYHFKFRVPGANGTKIVVIKADNEVVGSIDVGNTGSSQSWFDVETDLSLKSGVQLLQLSCDGIVTIHRIDIGYLATMTETHSERNILVIPNPSSGDFIIQVRNSTDRVVLYDVLGNIANVQPVKESSLIFRIHSDLRPGIYVLIATGQDEECETVKIVRTR